MKAYPIRNGEIFEPEIKEERTNKHRKEKEQECNCNRPYEIELTEQEWLQTATTEQLAEFLYDIAYFDNWSDTIMNDSLINGTAVEDAIEEWLKQPHTEKER